MIYWVHIARSIDRVTLHKERCSEAPANVFSSDFWEGGWFDDPEKERILVEIGEYPDRQGLIKTPIRVARMYAELTSGYSTDIEKLVNEAIFDVDYQEMVLVKDIEFYSMCEHHLLPFFGRAHVAYIPNGKVIGLSKIPRIVEMFARRLQVQERMTTQIARLIEDILNPQGVAVVVEGSHKCSMMRGIKKSQATMTTTTMLGAFQENRDIKAEFMAHMLGRCFC